MGGEGCFETTLHFNSTGLAIFDLGGEGCFEISTGEVHVGFDLGGEGCFEITTDGVHVEVEGFSNISLTTITGGLAIEG